ncbi:MAG: exonuclease [Myxococcales bacterium]|nr:exonuclease [Myxococcales bacterium]
MGRFVALDFETANLKRDSACQIALAVVEDNTVVETRERLIRPPSRQFTFTYVHGLTWRDVADADPFDAVWPEFEALLEGAEFIAAHNAGFDRSVLRACCERSGLEMPRTPFVCTVQMARQVWQLKRARLPDVCEALSIPLRNHHNAGADATACARIVIEARRTASPLEIRPLGSSRKRKRRSGAPRRRSRT